MTEHRNDDGLPSLATREWIDVKIAGLRSEMRLLFVLAVAGNQLLSHLQLDTTVGFIVNGAVIGLAALKLAIFR